MLTAQNCPSNVTPIKAIGTLAQTTNAENYQNGFLFSVAFDGLSTERSFISEQIFQFLRGTSRVIGICDPKHVVKAIRSNLVLGRNFVSVGNSYFDVGLQKLAGIPISLYEIQDFASEAVVLGL